MSAQPMSDDSSPAQIPSLAGTGPETGSGWGDGPLLGSDGDDPAITLLLSIVRRVRFASDTPGACLRCRSNQVIRWGRFSGRQRYRCKVCERTFSDLTGTAMAYSKRPELWKDFGQCMVEGISVRAVGRRLGITKDTAFRWRHLLCDRYRLQSDPPITGAAVLGATYLTISEKGRRPRDRPSRKKRGWLRGPKSSGVAHVIFAQEEATLNWRFALFCGGRMQPRAQDLIKRLKPLLASGTDLILDRAPCPSLGALAREGEHRLLGETGRRWLPSSRPNVRPSIVAAGGMNRTRASRAVSRIRGLVRNWRLWLSGFQGVATRYLCNYLGWHRQLRRVTDGAATKAPAPESKAVPGTWRDLPAVGMLIPGLGRMPAAADRS